MDVSAEYFEEFCEQMENVYRKGKHIEDNEILFPYKPAPVPVTQNATMKNLFLSEEYCLKNVMKVCEELKRIPLPVSI